MNFHVEMSLICKTMTVQETWTLSVPRSEQFGGQMEAVVYVCAILVCAAPKGIAFFVCFLLLLLFLFCFFVVFFLEIVYRFWPFWS